MQGVLNIKRKQVLKNRVKIEGSSPEECVYCILETLNSLYLSFSTDWVKICPSLNSSSFTHLSIIELIEWRCLLLYRNHARGTHLLSGWLVMLRRVERLVVCRLTVLANWSLQSRLCSVELRVTSHWRLYTAIVSSTDSWRWSVLEPWCWRELPLIGILLGLWISSSISWWSIIEAHLFHRLVLRIARLIRVVLLVLIGRLLVWPFWILLFVVVAICLNSLSRERPRSAILLLVVVIVSVVELVLVVVVSMLTILRLILFPRRETPSSLFFSSCWVIVPRRASNVSICTLVWLERGVYQNWLLRWKSSMYSIDIYVDTI